MVEKDSIGTHIDRWMAAQEGRDYWTREARLDLRFAAGKTWTWQELEVFRNQEREPPNYNLTAPMLRLVAGVEASNRSDVKYLPKKPSDVDGAEAVTKLGMMVTQQNSGNRQISRAFWDAINVGVGYIETGFSPDPAACELLRRRVDAFDIYPDPNGKEPDTSDWIDVFRSGTYYPEILANRFPGFKKEIMSLGSHIKNWDNTDLDHSSDYTDIHGDYPDVVTASDLDYFTGRMSEINRGKPPMVRAVERWYKKEEWVRVVKFKDGRVIEPNGTNNQMLAYALVNREAKLVRGIVPRIRVAIFLPDFKDLLLQDAKSPYSHGQFPFIPIWAYEDENGVPMGMIRQIRTPQRDFNARMAHLLKRSLFQQVHYEADAFVDVNQALEAISLPNGAVEYAEGGLQKAQIINDLQGSPIEQNLLQVDMQFMTDLNGVPQEMYGQETNASSGKAIAQRQQQGQTALYTLFDNRNWAQERLAYQELINMQEAFTEEQAVRATESTSGIKWIFINQQDPSTGQVLNPIAQRMYDVSVTQVSQKATEDMHAVEALTQMAASLPPQLQVLFVPRIAELSRLPNSADLIKELDAVKQAMLMQMLAPMMQQQAMMGGNMLPEQQAAANLPEPPQQATGGAA